MSLKLLLLIKLCTQVVFSFSSDLAYSIIGDICKKKVQWHIFFLELRSFKISSYFFLGEGITCAALIGVDVYFKLCLGCQMFSFSFAQLLCNKCHFEFFLLIVEQVEQNLLVLPCKNLHKGVRPILNITRLKQLCKNNKFSPLPPPESKGKSFFDYILYEMKLSFWKKNDSRHVTW